MSRVIKKGATDQTIYVEILDSTSTTGGRKTGLVFNTASLTAYYVRNGGSAVAITLATLAAANSAHSDGGFKEVDATNMPGVYRLDLVDAAVATGAESVVVTVRGATGAAQVSAEIQLVDNTSADVYGRVGAPVGASISADVAAVKTQTAAIEVDTADIQARLPAALVSGRIDASVGAMAANVLTATAIASDAITDAKVAADVTIASVTGAVGSVTGAVGSVTGNVGGNVTGSVGSVATGGIVAASFAAGAIDAAAIATDAIGSAELAASAVTEIQSGLATSANQTTIIGYIDTEVAAILAAVDTEVAAIKAKT